MSWYREWAPYVSVGTKIARGHAAAKRLAAKEGRAPCPVKIDGRKIANTFWGLKWCENLERYRDISNRLPRGATYVRNGSVADLVIEAGRVRAIVGGSEAYKIEIKIKPLKPDVWQAISRDCAQEIESLFDLLQARFKDGVMQRLTQADGGLFPHKNEISMSCSCPDSAGVCKHIAATFYGVAARLDHQPELLFRLRNVDHLELIGHAISADNLDRVLGGGEGAALSDSDLNSIFGIELEPQDPAATLKAKSNSKRTGNRKAVSVQPVVAATPAVRTSAPRKTRSLSTPSTRRSNRLSDKPVTKTEAKAVAKKTATTRSKSAKVTAMPSFKGAPAKKKSVRKPKG